MFYKLFRTLDGHIRKLRYGDSANRHGKGFGLQTLAAASRAGRVPHIGFDILFRPIRLRFTVAPFEIGDDPFKRRVERAAAVLLLILYMQFFLSRAVKQSSAAFFGDVFPRGIAVKAVFLFYCGKIHIRNGVFRIALPAGNGDRTRIQRKTGIGHNERFIDRERKAEAGTFGTGAERAVEREHPRSKFLYAYAAVRAGVIL